MWIIGQLAVIVGGCVFAFLAMDTSPVLAGVIFLLALIVGGLIGKRSGLPDT